MPIKSFKLLTLIVLLAVAVLFVSGCGKSGTKFPNQAPTIMITSYEGYDDSELLAPFENETFLFQQKIFWNASDPDGIVSGFAYRVKDQNGNPIATPGNHFVDMDGSVTPQNVLDRFGVGWVLHYKPNADEDIALDDPEADRTIWSTQKYAVINFPAADANGNPLTTNSTFEVIAIDNRGDITTFDPAYPTTSIAWRKFNATSARPTCNVTTTKGNPNGEQVGSGIRLSFTMHDSDPFINETPFKFEFQMMKVDPTSHELIGEPSQWYDSVTEADPEIDTYLLTRYTTPPLTYDVVNNVATTLTKIQARTYDLAGVVSTPSDTTALLFAVKDGFRPRTDIYPQRVYALGDNHYVDYTDESIPEILPFTIVGGVQRYATSFFVNSEQTLTAVNSSNLKVWLRWGWWGEYGIVQASGSVDHTNNPYDKKIDDVLDRFTDENYFSEITGFDIRLDNEAYNYPPYANSHVTDTDGKEWLRIPLYSPLGQTLVLTSLTSGTHTLEVRCIDLQGEVDPQPATINFTVVDPIAVSQREGVLVIDDDLMNAQTSPEPIVMQKYQDMLADYTGTVDFLKRTTNQEAGDTYVDYRLRHLATSDMQKYKLIIYHSDNPSSSGVIKNEHDGLLLYMKTGGNVVVSHTSMLASVLDAFVLATQRSFIGYFGVSYVSPPASLMSNALQTRPYFQKAVGQLTYPDIDLQWGASGTPEAGFNPIVNLRQGLATVTYFATQAPQTDVIYRMGLKPVGYPSYGPTQAEFDLYNNQPVALRKVSGDTHCYIFGFPLSYMQVDDAKAMMNKILSEVM